MLSAVEGKERLTVFPADMAEERSFDDAIAGCAALFHVAASMDLHLAPDLRDVGKPRAVFTLWSHRSSSTCSPIKL
jgi:hypothetical protein